MKPARLDFYEEASAATTLEMGAQADVLEGLSESFARGLVSSLLIEVESIPLWPKQKILAMGVIAKMAKLDFSPLLRDTNYAS
jgi:hypothetical protein